MTQREPASVAMYLPTYWSQAAKLRTISGCATAASDNISSDPANGSSIYGTVADCHRRVVRLPDETFGARSGVAVDKRQSVSSNDGSDCRSAGSDETGSSANGSGSDEYRDAREYRDINDNDRHQNGWPVYKTDIPMTSSPPAISRRDDAWLPSVAAGWKRDSYGRKVARGGQTLIQQLVLRTIANALDSTELIFEEDEKDKASDGGFADERQIDRVIEELINLKRKLPGRSNNRRQVCVPRDILHLILLFFFKINTSLWLRTEANNFCPALYTSRYIEFHPSLVADFDFH